MGRTNGQGVKQGVRPMGDIGRAVSNIFGSVGDVFSGGTKPPPKPEVPEAPTPPVLSSAEDDLTREGEVRSRRRARGRVVSGRSGSILTSPLGLSEPATTSLKQLLGA